MFLFLKNIINKMMFVLLLLTNVVLAENCSDRTKYYEESELNNADYYYFDPRTYSFDALDKIDRDGFRKMTKATIKCTGIWCVDGEWKCNNGNSNCYHVEHIIPTANNIKEIANCSTDILGNLIMSYGAWNQALSNKYYGEKVKIYGEKIVHSAYQSVYRACHGQQAKYYPDTLCLPADNFMNYLPFLIGLLIISIIITVTCFLLSKYYEKDDIIALTTH